MSTCYLMGSVPMYGGSPSFISRAIMPRDQMSTLYSCTFICICIYNCVCVFVFKFWFIFVFWCDFVLLFVFVIVLCSFTRLWCPKFHLGVICLLVHNLGRKIRNKVDLCKLLFSSLRLKRNADLCQICLLSLWATVSFHLWRHPVWGACHSHSHLAGLDLRCENQISDYRNQDQDQDQN